MRQLLDSAHMPKSADEPSRTPLYYWQGLSMLPRSIWAPLVAMSAIAISAYLVNEWSLRRIVASAASMASLVSAQKDLVELRARLVDAETSQRGYLLSRDITYLRPYEESLELLPVIGARLRASLADHADLLPVVDKLESLRTSKMAELRTTLELARSAPRGDVALTGRLSDGRAQMEAFRTAGDSLSALLDRQINQQLAQTAQNAQWFRMASAALGALLLVLLLVAVKLLITDLWRQDSARRLQTGERLRLQQLVEERTTELSNLTTHMQSASEQEKAELARDLHDELGGLLTAAKMDLAWLQGRASAAEPEARGKLDALESGLDHAMDVKRRVVENLRPALLDHFGLAVALQTYFEDTCASAGIDFACEIPDNFELVRQDVAIALFRVGQEALTNILRHAHAAHVHLKLESDDNSFRVFVTDDGVGIDPARMNGTLSHGLVGMRHRIHTLNGQLTISGVSPRGTCVAVSVPRPGRIPADGAAPESERAPG